MQGFPFLSNLFPSGVVPILDVDSTHVKEEVAREAHVMVGLSYVHAIFERDMPAAVPLGEDLPLVDGNFPGRVPPYPDEEFRKAPRKEDPLIFKT